MVTLYTEPACVPAPNPAGFENVNVVPPMYGVLRDLSQVMLFPMEGGPHSVYFEAEAAVVVTDSLFRDWPVKAYCVFGVRLEDVHGLLVCCHVELMGAVVFANCRPEGPLDRLLGVFVEAIVMAFSPTTVNAKLPTGSIAVYFETPTAVVVIDMPLRDCPKNK